MRRTLYVTVTLCSSLWLAGCGVLFPADETDGGGNLIDAVVAANTVTNDGSDSSSDSEVGGGSGNPLPAESQMLEGATSGEGAYQLFRVGASQRGDRWTVTPITPLSDPMVIVLFDENMNLLMRSYGSGTLPLEHVLRSSTNEIHVGVMTPSGSRARQFRLRATRLGSQGAPDPQRQVVWLNFGSAQNLSVNRRAAVSFSPFTGAMLGAPYAGYTDLIRSTIIATMRADYARYDIDIRTSLEGPPPAGEVSIVHFGGNEANLLGLADTVDSYNVNKSQNAIVFVESFARYYTMQLAPDEMAVMISNVASHELGHLLGLYHTRDPLDVMDTTGTAWQLSEDQAFARAALEPTVFAVGMSDSPALLEQTLGVQPDSAKLAVIARSYKLPIYQFARRLAQDEIPYTCGTCLHLDD